MSKKAPQRWFNLYTQDGGHQVSFRVAGDHHSFVHYVMWTTRHGLRGVALLADSWSGFKVLGRAPVDLLDHLFIELAESLEWEIVCPANRESRNAVEQEHGVFVARPIDLCAGAEIDLEFRAQINSKPMWSIRVTTEQALELLEWIASVADWELEDLVEEKITARRRRELDLRRRAREAMLREWG